MNFYDILIIGGGASGVFCALALKDLGKEVAIIESSDRICKKLLTTGNGRCNISNEGIKAPFINFHSNNNNFFYSALNTYSVEYIKDIFLSLGLPITTLKEGKMYPKSLQASSVIDIFRLNLEEKNIPIFTSTKAISITKNKNIFKITTNNDENPHFKCNKLILCTGGKSAPKTGSDGNGYKLAESFGHNIIKPLPGIVQLKLEYPYLKAMSGIKFDGVAKLIINNKITKEYFGEILFTDYGISGPPILQLSSHASKALANKNDVKISIDMNNKMSLEDFENFIEGHLGIFSYRSVSDALIGVINKKLIPSLLKECKIYNMNMPCYELDWKCKNKLISTLKDWSFKVIDTNGFNNAQVTVGGVDTTGINPNSLESKLIENLYFCGEIIDVHGDCGGFNLQWAWSSALLCANSLK